MYAWAGLRHTMSGWWIAFIVAEVGLLGGLVVSKLTHKPSSADMEIGEEIGNALLIGLAVLLAVIAFLIFAWHHFRFVG